MKIREGLTLRKLGDQYVVIALGEASKKFNGIIRLNATGALLFECPRAGAGPDDLTAALMREYEVGEGEAARDAAGFTAQFVRAGLLEA